MFGIQRTYKGSSVCIKGAQWWQMMLHQLLLPLNKDYRFLIENNYFLLLFSPHGFCQCNSSPILFSFFFFLWSSNVFLFPPSVSLCGYWEDTHSAASKGRCQWVAIHQVCVCVCVCVIGVCRHECQQLLRASFPRFVTSARWQYKYPCAE